MKQTTGQSSPSTKQLWKSLSVMGTFLLIMGTTTSVLGSNASLSGNYLTNDTTYQWNVDTLFIDGDAGFISTSTLIINPGTRVIARGNYKLNIVGNLIAEGTEEDSIYFYSDDIVRGWKGIEIGGAAATKKSMVKHISVRHSNRFGVIIEGETELSNSLIELNKGGGIDISISKPVLISHTHTQQPCQW